MQLCTADIENSNEILLSSGGDNTGPDDVFSACHAEQLAALLQFYMPDSLPKQITLLHYLLQPSDSQDVLVVLHPAKTNLELMACLQRMPNIKVSCLRA